MFKKNKITNIIKNYKPTSTKFGNLTAFSLIELSVVLVIISILVLGSVKGAAYIKAAKLSRAKTITANIYQGNQENLVAWFETSFAESFINQQDEDGSVISKWNNLPQKNNNQCGNFASATNNQIIYRRFAINNLPSIQFKSGGSMKLENFCQGSLFQATIFIVFKPEFSGSENFTLLDSYNTQSSISISSNKIKVNAGTIFETNATFDNRKPYILALYFNQNNSKLFLNQSTNPIASGVNFGNNPIAGLTIGSGQDGSNSFKGLISEIIIFDNLLKAEKRDEIFQYLSEKYVKKDSSIFKK